MVRTVLTAAFAVVLLFGCSGETKPASDSTRDAGAGSDPGTGDHGGTGSATESGRFAEGIHIIRVEANQGVAVDLSSNGQTIAPGSRNAGLVRGRVTLIRAFWSLNDAWRRRDIVATLYLERADGTVASFQDSQLVDGPPDPEVMDGAFHWRLDADEVTPGTRFAVALEETASSALGTAEPELGARIPLSGYADLGIIDAPMTLKIVLVPFAPPAGQAVAVADRDKEAVEEALMELSPVQGIEVTWAAPFTQSAVYQRTDEAWSDIYSVRDALGLGSDEYCHALLNPSGCCDMDAFSFKGLGGKPGDGQGDWDTQNRSAMVMIEIDVRSAAPIIVHELGHNHGLSHAPCGDVDDPDRDYPYPGGTVGTQGYGILTGELHSGDPDIEHPYYDMMTYCWPVWYSDYNFEAIRQRIQTISSWGSFYASARAAVLHAFVSDGGVTWRLSPGASRSGDIASADPRRLNHNASAAAIVGGIVLPLDVVETATSGDLRDYAIFIPDALSDDLETVELTVDGATFTGDFQQIAAAR